MRANRMKEVIQPYKLSRSFEVQFDFEPEDSKGRKFQKKNEEKNNDEKNKIKNEYEIKKNPKNENENMKLIAGLQEING